MTTPLNSLLELQENNEQKIALNARLERLQANADFRELVLKLWMVDDCARYAQLSQAPQLTPEQREDSLNMAAAAGHFKRWMAVKFQEAQVALNMRNDLSSEIDELRAEGAE